jgi:hypothetical protein
MTTNTMLLSIPFKILAVMAFRDFTNKENKPIKIVGKQNHSRIYD